MMNLDILWQQLIQLNQLTPNRIEQLKQPWEFEDVPLIPALEAVVKRIQTALNNGEKIAIVGDYDADGVCATTILFDTLQRLNASVGYYIPNRLTEGYGLTVDIIQRLQAKDYQLIITVDNGVKAQEALTYAEDQGLDVIVTDHHQCDDFLAFRWLLHPQQFPQRYQGLCGAGLVFELSRVLLRKIEPYYLVLAMIATIGDVMTVFEENRVIIQAGLKALNQQSFPTIMALLDKKSEVNEMDIGFQVVPKINTLGRLADQANANQMVRYFLCENQVTIMDTAKQINQLNQTRKKLTEQALGLTVAMKQYGLFSVLMSSDIHEGVMGILAGKIMNQQQRPVIIMTTNQTTVKASARSPQGFDLYQFLLPFKSLFTAFGGHAAACGFSLETDKVPEFLRAIQAASENIDFQPEPVASIPLLQNDLSFDLISYLEQLRPFGHGFSYPLFTVKNFHYQDYNLFSKGYLRLKATANEVPIEAISFHSYPKQRVKQLPNPIALTGSLSINEFKGQRKLNIICQIIDF